MLGSENFCRESNHQDPFWPSKSPASYGGPQVNKFEQVSSFSHQVSLPGGSLYRGGPWPGCGRCSERGQGRDGAAHLHLHKTKS